MRRRFVKYLPFDSRGMTTDAPEVNRATDTSTRFRKDGPGMAGWVAEWFGSLPVYTQTFSFRSLGCECLTLQYQHEF
ncbi:hypothetical protein E2C01_077103 [Portunus trituberculatus]|uniref:Uncharacterized protein n=1 Tax=Portunus trituberculatus TaxID=210409 RepID=A0A5B7IJC7_PORTR|nr:hypothetical protein [Portunus trituberculatus]